LPADFGKKGRARSHYGASTWGKFKKAGQSEETKGRRKRERLNAATVRRAKRKSCKDKEAAE